MFVYNPRWECYSWCNWYTHAFNTTWYSHRYHCWHKKLSVCASCCAVVNQMQHSFLALTLKMGQSYYIYPVTQSRVNVFSSPLQPLWNDSFYTLPVGWILWQRISGMELPLLQKLHRILRMFPHAYPHLYKLLTSCHSSQPPTFLSPLPPSFRYPSLDSQFSPILSFVHHNLATGSIYYLGKPSATVALS